MAGSQNESSIVHHCTDPILTARLEAIKQLAGGFSDRVAVLDPEFNVIYVNESVWSENASGLSGCRLRTRTNISRASVHRPCSV